MTRSLISYVSIFFISILLVSCDVTTLKGNWRSEKVDNGNSYKLYIEKDHRFKLYEMPNDSVYSNLITGTWQEKNDSLFLYSQNAPSPSISMAIAQMSMDNMTLEYGRNKVLIFNRIYNNPDDKFNEVLAQKGGFWYGLYLIIGIILIIGFGFVLINCLGDIFSFIKNHWLKKRQNSNE